METKSCWAVTLVNHVKSGQSEAVIRLQHAFKVQGVIAQSIDVLGQVRADAGQRLRRHLVAGPSRPQLAQEGPIEVWKRKGAEPPAL